MCFLVILQLLLNLAHFDYWSFQCGTFLGAVEEVTSVISCFVRGPTGEGEKVVLLDSSQWEATGLRCSVSAFFQAAPRRLAQSEQQAGGKGNDSKTQKLQTRRSAAAK